MHCNQPALARRHGARGEDAPVWSLLSLYCPGAPPQPGEIACLSRPEHISVTPPELNHMLDYPRAEESSQAKFTEGKASQLASFHPGAAVVERTN